MVIASHPLWQSLSYIAHRTEPRYILTTVLFSIRVLSYDRLILHSYAILSVLFFLTRHTHQLLYTSREWINIVLFEDRFKRLQSGMSPFPLRILVGIKEVPARHLASSKQCAQWTAHTCKPNPHSRLSQRLWMKARWLVRGGATSAQGGKRGGGMEDDIRDFCLPTLSICLSEKRWCVRWQRSRRAWTPSDRLPPASPQAETRKLNVRNYVRKTHQASDSSLFSVRLGPVSPPDQI